MKTTIPIRVSELVKRHGGVRAAARVTQLDPAYLSRLMRGVKKEPSIRTLKRLGLKKVVTYFEA